MTNPTLHSHTHYQAAPADPQAKTWQRVCLFQPATDRKSGRKKNTERTTSVTVAQLPFLENSFQKHNI